MGLKTVIMVLPFKFYLQWGMFYKVVNEDDCRGPSNLYKSTTDGDAKLYVSSTLVLL